jgi:hypothetical protein
MTDPNLRYSAFVAINGQTQLLGGYPTPDGRFAMMIDHDTTVIVSGEAMHPTAERAIAAPSSTMLGKVSALVRIFEPMARLPECLEKCLDASNSPNGSQSAPSESHADPEPL